MTVWDTTGLAPEDQPRFEYVNREQISDDLKEVFDSIVAVSYRHMTLPTILLV